jgi:hypothetical protein
MELKGLHGARRVGQRRLEVRCFLGLVPKT